MFAFKLQLIFVILIFINLASTTKFTHIECKALNANLVKSEHCRLEHSKNNQTTFSILFKTKYAYFDDVQFYIRYAKKTTGSRYKTPIPPFKIDFCKFLAEENNPFLSSIYRMVKSHTNINHTCPFRDMFDIIVEKFVLDERILLWKSFEIADYAIYVTFFVDKIPSFAINLFFNLNK